jgi:hypothetical protein
MTRLPAVREIAWIIVGWLVEWDFARAVLVRLLH